MKDKDLLLKELIGKDESKAQNAADYLINNTDLELYKMLIDKSDYLFPFVLKNVSARIENSVTSSNFLNIIKFFTVYSGYYDDLLVSILAKHANENLTDEIFDLLENGTIDQKTYAAKYFAYIPDTVALETLCKYAFENDENLSSNSAESLGQMQDDISFDIALDNLKSNDDFDKLKAVKFFCAYGRNFPFNEIFEAMKTSKMPENIAGQIPYMESLLTLLESKYKESSTDCIYYIIQGLGEILPLSDLFQFEMSEVLEKLIFLNKNNYSPKIAVILLSALSKFSMFCENEEYIYDENKDTKAEIKSILALLKNENEKFWSLQKQYALELLKGNDKEIIAVLPIISDFNIKEAIGELKTLVQSSNEIVVCEVLSTLKSLNALENSDINSVVKRIQNSNIKALIENLNI